MTTKQKETNNGNLVSTMSYKKATPGTFVYAADDPDSFIPSLYIRKAGMPQGAKMHITITIEVGDNGGQ